MSSLTNDPAGYGPEEDELDLLRQIADERPWTQEERQRFDDISNAQEAAALAQSAAFDVDGLTTSGGTS